MTKSVLILVTALLLHKDLLAQAPQKLKPWGAVEAGAMTGSSGAAFDYRIEGGVGMNNWKWGMGGAYDRYRFTSIPIFAQARKYFGDGRNRLFLLGSAGVNIPTADPPSNGEIFNDSWNYSPTSNHRYHTGIYAEAGAGISFFAKRKAGLELSLLYNRKSMKETYLQSVYNGTDGNEQVENWTKYRMNRMVLRIATRIN
jgi:hypothetical protein